MSYSVFSYENLVHAVSGAVGSVTAMTVFFPLDTARLRLQVDDNRKAKSTPAILADIIREEGLLCCSNFVYFYCFHSLKASWLKGRPSAPSNDLMIGIAADAFAQIIRDEGGGALWNGTFPSLLLVMNPAIQFMIYEGLKRQLRRGVPREFGQFNESTGESKLLSSLRTIKCLLINRVRKFGMLGLFKGLEAKLLQTVLTAALMFLLYEKIASSTFKMMGLSRNHYKKH
ncbi:hypothetical protein F7725_003759 [Dissostichus mawsoni]|uniref:Peroxisomal membrane protein PMP34 n=1 Tax=Dissostichus mawsoni TaxID=36200 RepID=A0A7J5YCH7_DISMA|nr:hypothetical protein F7725_003759 [Dissostichus mawsoni]